MTSAPWKNCRLGGNTLELDGLLDRDGCVTYQLADSLGRGYAFLMPGTNWIILMILALVFLAPLSEILDQSDALSQDGSDFVIYIICLLGFLVYSLAHTSFMVAQFAATELQILIPCLQRIESRDSKQERNLLLSCHHLRI
jgi:hypothetical protein